MKKLFLAVGLFAIWHPADAQVGVGTATPNASSVLELSSTTKGFLPPRMTASQRGAISSPANGLLVFQTDGASGLYYNSGTAASPNWRIVNTGSYTGLTVLSTTGSSYSHTVPLSAVGGLTMFDLSGAANPITINVTLPSPSSAGNGARLRFSYNGLSGSVNTNFSTSSGTIYPASGTPGTTISGMITSEFISDGTNWREVPPI